jgi:uncharacterized membrane protein
VLSNFAPFLLLTCAWMLCGFAICALDLIASLTAFRLHYTQLNHVVVVSEIESGQYGHTIVKI